MRARTGAKETIWLGLQFFKWPVFSMDLHSYTKSLGGRTFTIDDLKFSVEQNSATSKPEIRMPFSIASPCFGVDILSFVIGSIESRSDSSASFV